MKRVARGAGAVLAAALVAVAAGAAAQSYPSKPIRLIVPFPPGGATDVLGRIVGQKLSESLGQQVVIDNRPGASGSIGAELTARAPPDGHTIFVGQASNLAINLTLIGKLPYDPVKDFAPVTLIAQTPNLLVVHPSLPVRSVKDLIALAKAKPGAINYASAGSGSPGHLAAELLKKSAKIDMVHIPYKGAAPALTDVVAGNASLYFTSPISAQPFVQAGRLRMVAVTSAKRSLSLPDVPAIAEAGFPEFDLVSWWGVLTPAGVSRDIVARLNSEIIRVLGLPDVKQRYANLGADAVTNTPEQFAAYIRSEIAKWARVVKES
jgi:tripartite-type tricarboxylate transporter receptor subunit TctC